MTDTEYQTTPTDISTPWTLHFEGDGTEDIAIIRDANGEDLAASRPFWQPEGDDPIPPTLAAMRLMKAAPDLLAAAETARDRFGWVIDRVVRAVGLLNIDAIPPEAIDLLDEVTGSEYFKDDIE